MPIFRLLVIVGDTTPELQRHRYPSWGAVCDAAIRKKKQLSEQDGLYWVKEGKMLQIGAFCAGMFEED